jgi:hypothetical protein
MTLHAGAADLKGLFMIILCDVNDSYYGGYNYARERFPFRGFRGMGEKRTLSLLITHEYGFWRTRIN